MKGVLKELRDGINILITLHSSRKNREVSLSITREIICFKDLSKLGSLAWNRIHPLDKALGLDVDVSRISLFYSRHLHTTRMLSIAGFTLLYSASKNYVLLYINFYMQMQLLHANANTIYTHKHKRA